MEQAATVGGNVLAMAGAEAEKGAELVIPSTEPRGGLEGLEAPHTSDPTFHAAVVLLEPIVPVGTGPVLHASSECCSDRARVGAVPAPSTWAGLGGLIAIQ